jgi:hypothetical protein
MHHNNLQQIFCWNQYVYYNTSTHIANNIVLIIIMLTQYVNYIIYVYYMLTQQFY